MRPSGLVTGGVTAATPGWAATWRSTAGNFAASAPAGSSATSWNGPLKPGPNPLASRS